MEQGDHPVAGVSYYEAEAYARWAWKRLPGEREWQKAAYGEDGREYPWGDQFGKEKCNSAEAGFGHTTPVTQYPNGVSPYGCYDMAGNVWEWCADTYGQSNSSRVCRGRCHYVGRVEQGDSYNRTGLSPDHRNISIGFRLVQGMP